MDFAEYLKNFKFDYTSSHPDIEYLNKVKVTHTISRGLAELYKIQPKNPTTFLANWLLNESRSSEIIKQSEENKKIKEDIKKHYDIIKAKREEEAKLIQEQQEKIQKEKENFIEKIKSCTDFEDNMNYYCEELKKFANATGVYVSIYDKKRKPTISEEDDENSHLLEEKALRYINFCNDHQFMKNKYLDAGNGITYKLIFPGEETTVVDGDNINLNNNQGIDENISNQNPENAEHQNHNEPDSSITKSEENLAEIYEKEVVMRPEMKFFREPRLGCYLAVDMSYLSSLNNDSLVSAINNFIEFRSNISAQEERRRQHDLRTAELQKERIEASASGNYPNEELNKLNEELFETFNEEPVKLQDFYKIEKKLILSLDTLGQDREFSDEEKKLIHRIIRAIKLTWEKLEEKLLLKDRDLKMEIDDINKILNEMYTYDKLLLEEEKFIKERFDSDQFKDNPIKDEKLKQIQTEISKTKFIMKYFFDDENIETVFLKYSELEFVKFDSLFQNILYFIGVNNRDINEENTNKLEWKKAKKFWNIKVIEKLRDYSPIGPKLGKVNPYSYVNRIINNLENLSPRREEIRAESFVLDRLLEFMLLILKIRRDDIMIRREEISEMMEKRNVAIVNHKEREERRSRDLEEARNSFTANRNIDDADGDDQNNQDVQEFNEEDFLKKWDEENPEIEIPEEVFYDEDGDYEIEKL
jgi:hypothetical protein